MILKIILIILSIIAIIGSILFVYSIFEAPIYPDDFEEI